MIALEDIKNDMELVNNIDWEMTPEEAVELACISIPARLADSFLESVGHHKGIYGLSRELREWLEREINADFSRLS